MTILRLHIACCIPKAKNTHLGYVMLSSFPLQKWLYEGSLVLRYTYIACPFKTPRAFVVEKQL